MDQQLVSVITSALNSPDMMAAILFILFITKRIVPYWTYEELRNELNAMKEAERTLRDEFDDFKKDIMEQIKDKD